MSQKGCEKAKTLSKKGCEKAKTLSKKGCDKAKTLSQKGCEKAKTLSKILFSTPQISESIPFLFLVCVVTILPKHGTQGAKVQGISQPISRLYYCRGVTLITKLPSLQVISPPTVGGKNNGAVRQTLERYVLCSKCFLKVYLMDPF